MAKAKNRIVEHFQELAAEADYLALWLDCDKEVQYWQLMQLAAAVNESA